MSKLRELINNRPGDLLLVCIIVASLILAVAAISSELDRREAMLTVGGARKVDAAKIRRQISDGELSPTKALFYKKVPR